MLDVRDADDLRGSTLDLGAVALVCALVACGGEDPSSGDTTSTADASDGGTTAGDATTGAGANPLVYRQVSFAGITLEAQADGFTWYRDIVGLEPHGSQWFGLGDGRSSVEVFSGGAASAVAKTPAQQAAVIGLQVPDIAASQAALEGRGVVFEGPIDGEPTDSWIYFADPEGNRLELKQLGEAGPGFEVSRIAWVGVYVQDLTAMTAWYRDVLGLEQNGSHHYYDLVDGSSVELFAGGTAAAGPKDATAQPVVFSLVVEDLDAALAELATRGVEMAGPIVEYQEPDWPDERSTEIADPEGNRILIKQFTE